MSGIGSTSGTTSSSVTYGTNTPPISFPGIASGIDYNSIIQKYAGMTAAQATPLQTKVSALNKQQAELLKIQDLLAKFQDSFTAVSDPSNFTATTGTASTPGMATFTDVKGQSATPGTYSIQKVRLATATQIASDPAADAPIQMNQPLAQAGFQISPQNGTVNGSPAPATLTIDGVQLTNLDVNSATPTTLLNAINSNAQLTALGVSAAINGSGQLVITQTNTSQPLTIGSAGDVGNLAQVLKLDTAPVTGGGASPYTITSSGPLGGINEGSTFNTNNNAGFATPVTTGSFTINGVQITVDATSQNLANVIAAINSSAAGVIASYDATSGAITLSNKTTGTQGIVLGSATDSSNFLQAAGFLKNYQTPGTLSAGATQTVGQPAQVVYTDPSGNTHTAYSASNDVTNVIPGIDMKILQPTNVSGSDVPYSVTVTQDTTTLQSAITGWVNAYNAVMDEINTATQAPVVGTQTDSASGQSAGAQLTTGGVLFNNQDVLSLRDQLVNLVSSALGGSSSGYNSLAQVGLQLDSSFTVSAATSGDSSTDATSAANTSSQNSVTTQTFQGTSGRLQSLNVSTLTAALSANPIAVQNLFVGNGSIVGQLGAYITSVTGLPTMLQSGIVGQVPAQSLFSTLSAQNNDQISSLQQQIKLVTDQANMQADMLRAEFTDSETQIAQLQSMQSSLSSFLSGSGA